MATRSAKKTRPDTAFYGGVQQVLLILLIMCVDAGTCARRRAPPHQHPRAIAGAATRGEGEGAIGENWCKGGW